MKQLGLITLIVLSMVLPAVIAAQDVSGGDIETVASSVVLIETIDGRRAIGTGTGTIVSSEGYIYTNRHVIEDGDDFAIYMLQDIREQPELRYYASLEYVSRDRDIDFAVLKIDRNQRGGAINPANENLPYYSPQPSSDITVGDRIRIFGYPGIGDGYMVVTTGEVTTVQNGSIGGSRLPVWFWTDAEISGGNSGGLAINDETGEWVGLPTWVVSEERTAGRLGGVLPLTAIQSRLVEDNYVVGANGGSSATAPRSGSSGGSGSDGDTTPDDNNVAPGIDGGQLMLVNQSGSAICGVYISPTTASDWGVNRLDSSDIIGLGDIRNFEFAPGEYDMLLQDCDGNDLEDTRNLNLQAPTVAVFDGAKLLLDAAPPAEVAPPPDDVAPPVGGDASLTIENRSDVSICYVYISSVNADVWGEDQLGDRDVIGVGTSHTWTLTPGEYDVLLQDCSGNDLRDTRGLNIIGSEVLQYP